MTATPLYSLGEDTALQRLLDKIKAPKGEQLLLGPGDDCAIVQRNGAWDTLLKTDALVEGIHFTPDTPAELIGRKALARPVSDIAAMGGLPEHALITLFVHQNRPIEQLEGIYAGLSDFAAEQGIALAGGETSALPQDGLAISIALTGRVERGGAILRSGGKPGDLLYVSGALGGSFQSGKHLTFTPRVQLARELLRRGIRPSAMMDISDGLAVDLPRLAQASGCGYAIEEAHLPCQEGCTPQQALCDGEDYELLLALPPALADQAELESLGLIRIGLLIPGKADRMPGGWQHFSTPAHNLS